MDKTYLQFSCCLLCVALASCDGSRQATVDGHEEYSAAIQQVPASKFDLSHWSLTVPLDINNDGVSDIFDAPSIQTYSHPDFFYLDNAGNLVFATPNRAATERTSTNTRSELRYMSRGNDTSIAESSPLNNFSLAAHPQAEKFSAVGGKLEATLHIDHVAQNAKHPKKPPAYSVVVGQVHAYQLDDTEQKPGLGWGNEPLKISYKKWPNHKTGSVFWAYERNLATDDPNRIDIAYPVWGSNWDNSSDPGEDGIALGDAFSYTVNIYKNTMYLTFSSAKHPTVNYQINLANNIDANGIIDTADHPSGYKDETLYFKAGAYNQCSTKADDPSFRYPACAGTGNWKTDVLNGDYTKVTFSKLIVGPATPLK